VTLETLTYLLAEYIYSLLRTLPTSEIAAIVEKLNPLLHLDPVLYLPPEITFTVFSYLRPGDVLKTTTLSKSWRSRALDSQIWRLLFKLEGWTTDLSRVRAFQEEERIRRLSTRERKSRARRADENTEHHISKKRAYEEHEEESNWFDLAQEWGEQHGVVEADDSQTTNLEDRMQDVAFDTPVTPGLSSRFGDPDAPPTFLEDQQAPPLPLEPPVTPTLVLPGSDDEPRVNWHYLYKQKRKLEDNWNNGRFVNFQLPHPNFPRDAHTECVYTIQYSGNYLVSGSRDKTVRIWNIETQRLAIPPLMGHSASVLCLQFDSSPEEDIVVSGGSDCHVLLWKFSTGELIRKLERAHSESVLNLRFDRDHLITCSKDKTIKVWNRKAILPTDTAYPSSTTSGAKFPSYIINMQQIADPQQLNVRPLREYSLLMTLEGHSAAVNAVQLYDGQIVSASGDRTVKIWNVRTGACLKTLAGHTKGIACVQFDGRRIVSGSSDETVRIFDRATGAEVACLQGHSNLVRTVQAAFGDIPGNEEELEAEAKAVDRAFFQAQDKGEVEMYRSRDRRRLRNAGSRDPRDVFALGAKLPPGGGGSKWGRIVSGSYDESVIIWKKENGDPKGKWVPGRVLLQNEAVRAAGGRPRRAAQNHGAIAIQHQQQAQLAQLQAQVTQTQTQIQAQGAHHHPPNQAQPGNGGNYVTLTTQTAGGPATVQAVQSFHHGNATPAGVQQAQAQTQQTIQQVHQNIQQLQQQLQQQQAALQAQQNAAAALTGQVGGIATVAQQAGPNGSNVAAIGPQQQQNHHHHHGHHHHHHHGVAGALPGVAQAQQAGGGGGARVFKLQFDARRIICCSQDPTIVGWDFANGDKDIMEASQFFGEVL
jgi:F-box and WD-40 domain protein 1/11